MTSEGPRFALFVYGLLKPGFGLHGVVAPFVVTHVPATTRGRLYDAGVPAARFDEDGVVEGVVLWLDGTRYEEALAVADDVEDEGEVYCRVEVGVHTADGRVVAQAYEWIGETSGLTFAGTWWPNA